MKWSDLNLDYEPEKFHFETKKIFYFLHLYYIVYTKLIFAAFGVWIIFDPFDNL